MKLVVGWIGIVTIALVLQTSLFPRLYQGHLGVDLLLVLVALYGLYRGQIPGLIAGMLVGLVADLAVGRYLGLNFFSLGVTGYMLGWASGRVYHENPLAPPLTLIVATIVYRTVYLFSSGVAGAIISWTTWWTTLPQAAVANGLVALITYQWLYRFWAQANRDRY